MKILIAACFFATALLSQPTFAQTDTSQSATVVFDVRMNMARNGNLYKSLELGETEQEALSGIAGGGPDFSKVDRIFGALSLPDSVGDFMGMQAGGVDLPMDFFVQFKFSDADAAEAMYSEMESDSKKEVVDGKTYIMPDDDDSAPTNLMAHRVDETTVEMGTRNYLLQPDRGRGLFTAGLNDSWDKVPDHFLRLAIDVEGERQLISEAINMAKAQAQGDPTTAAFLGLIDHMKNLRLSIDLDDKVMLELGSTAVSADKAQELASGLDSMLGMAKMTGAMMAGQIPDPKLSKVVTTILDSLKANASGAEVRVSIPRPEGLDDAIKSGVDQFKQMSAPGIGPGDFGNDG